MKTLLPSSKNFSPSIPPFLDNETLCRFKEQLLTKQVELVRKRSEIKTKIRSLKIKHADLLDQSIHMSSIENEILYSRRCDDLIAQIEKALERIENGEFGYCELTGDPIDIRRLEVQPWATLSIKALENIEKKHDSRRF
ncbi:TraR/DksA family transcriptional regulator [Desulfotignum balticum]|uniref:TraR/DksA family transcriptional regulator n=1 Tax=Desulfotignum balticum TaxID=115781 RepID=UPI0003F77BF4|nr:TraR/DksA C4-type zinc finger protein [Desulfotignum balticum]